MQLFVGCSNEPEVEQTTSTDEETEATTEKDTTEDEVEEVDLKPLELKIMYKDKQDAPFNPDWAMIKEIEERGNVRLEFEVVAEQQYNQKWQLAFNTGSVADIVTFVHPETMQPFAKGDLLVPISDYVDQMPNYQAYVASRQLEQEISHKTLSDGKYYWFQGFKDMAEYNAGIMVRKDLIEANGLTMPTTVEELEVVLIALKELYPDSYPMTGFNGMDMLLALTSPYFGTMAGWMSPDASGYDEDTGLFYNSYMSDKGKVMVEYYSRLYDGELLDPELFTQNFEQWLQRLVTQQSFVTVGFAPTLPLVNSTAQGMGIEGFEMVMLPPLSSAVEPESKAILLRSMSSWVLPRHVAEREDFDRIIEFIDWYLYSDEGQLLQNWGIEGLTYEVVDGNKQFIGDRNTRASEFGVGTDSLSIMQDLESIEAQADPILFAMTKTLYDSDRVFGSVKMLDYSDEQMEEVGILSSTIKDLSSRYYQQFIMDVLDVEEDWATFIEESEAAGASKLIDIKNGVQ